MSGILLIGGGGHCHACIDAIESQGIYTIEGIVDSSVKGKSSILGYPIVGGDNDLPALVKKTSLALVSVGQIKTPQIRIHLFNLLKSLGAELPVIVSGSAYQSRHALIDQGTILLHGASVNANAQIGANCIINSHVLVEHDANIADHCHISTGALINGGVKIETGCFIGSGVIVREGVKIGKNSVIGVGQVVMTNVSPGTILKNSYD